MQYNVHQPNYNALKKEGNEVGVWNPKGGIWVLSVPLITDGGGTRCYCYLYIFIDPALICTANTTQVSCHNNTVDIYH